MDYGKQRLMRIKENKMKMKELGVKAIAYEAQSSVDKKRKKNSKKNFNELLGNDVDYLLDGEDDFGEEIDTRIQQNMRNLRSHSKKVMATRDGSNVKNVEACMSENQRGGSMPINERDKLKESKSHPATKKKQNMLAPGSLSAYVRMKDRLRGTERLSKQLQTEQIQQTKDLSSSQQMDKQMSSSKLHNILGLVDEDDDYISSDGDDLKEKDEAVPEDIENNMVDGSNVPAPMEDNQNEQPDLQKRKRTRGPSLCKEVHGWSLYSRKLIILNELGQPIGPDMTTLDQFSQFLGSLTRSFDLAPLQKRTWHQVQNKDEIWDYVKSKFIIADEGRDYVLHSVGALWRNYKCRIKKTHYKNYETMTDRWKNRPSSIPKAHFADLLKYWNQKEVQAISEKKK